MTTATPPSTLWTAAPKASSSLTMLCTPSSKRRGSCSLRAYTVRSARPSPKCAAAAGLSQDSTKCDHRQMGELLDEYTVEMETQALLRFEVAYDAQDTSAMKVRLLQVPVPQRRFSSPPPPPASQSNYEVLRVLGFAKSAAQPFLAKHPLFMDVESVLPSASGRCGRCATARRPRAPQPRSPPPRSPEEVEVFMTDFLGKLSPILEDQNKIIDVVFGADAGRVMLLFVERVFEQTVRFAAARKRGAREEKNSLHE